MGADCEPGPSGVNKWFDAYSCRGTSTATGLTTISRPAWLRFTPRAGTMAASLRIYQSEASRPSWSEDLTVITITSSDVHTYMHLSSYYMIDHVSTYMLDSLVFERSEKLIFQDSGPKYHEGYGSWNQSP